MGAEEELSKFRTRMFRLYSNADRLEAVRPESGTVYRCQEKQCAGYPAHAHARRPYIAWSNPENKNA